MRLIQNTKITPALAYASGSADRNGAILDMKGYEGVLVLVHFSAIATGATTSVKMQQDTASDMATAADLAGSKITVADDDDDQVKYVDLHRPSERYVRVVIDKDATNATAESALYIQYGGKVLPEAQAAGSVEGEEHHAPAEGTA
jgi:hypothetical protein